MAPIKWPEAYITEVHVGKNGKVQVATLKIIKGTYMSPIVKVVPLLYQPLLKPLGLADKYFGT